MTEPDPRSGTVTLKGGEWSWTATPVPADDLGPAGQQPSMEWYDFVFRRKEDPEQEARGRGGLPAGRWSEENVREILRSCRVRTWRDGAGELWRVRRSRSAPIARVSPEMPEKAEGGSEETLTFVPVDGGDDGSFRRTVTGLASLAGLADQDLEELVKG